MPKEIKRSGYYAVAIGRTPGIYRSWSECEVQIIDFPGARYKKFRALADARMFIGSDSSGSEQHSAMSTTTSQLSNTKRAASSSHPMLDPDEEEYTVVYCDGACKGNGRSGSVAGIGVWWGSDDPRNIKERCPGAQTNNRAELIAIIRILEMMSSDIQRLMIKTDSNYALNCLNIWLGSWVKNGWRTAQGKPVMNRPLIEYLVALRQYRTARGHVIKFKHVKGHSGIIGNECADALANQGTYLPEEPEMDWDAKRVNLEQRTDGEITMTAEETGLKVESAVQITSRDTKGVQTKASYLCKLKPYIIGIQDRTYNDVSVDMPGGVFSDRSIVAPRDEQHVTVTSAPLHAPQEIADSISGKRSCSKYDGSPQPSLPAAIADTETKSEALIGASDNYDYSDAVLSSEELRAELLDAGE